MEYEIHNLHDVHPVNQQSFFEEEVRKKLQRIEKTLRHYPKMPVLNVFVKREGEHDHTVTASLKMKNKDIVVKETGTKAVLVVNNALDKLRNAIKEQLRLERKEHLRKRKNRFHAAAEVSMHQLKDHAQNDDNTAFTKLLNKILPELGSYIKQQVNKNPTLKQLLKKQVLTMDDIVDEVYVGIYQQLQNELGAPEKIELMAFSIADKEIQKITQKSKKEFRNSLSTELLNNEFYRGMKEELTADADFTPELAEDFEETYFYRGEYDIVEVLEDAGADEEIIEQAEAENIDVRPLLSDLPDEQKTVFEWYYLYHLETDEIARISNVSDTKVSEWLQEARTRIVSSIPQHA